MLLAMFVFLMIRRPPGTTRTDTLFPYTPLFRSRRNGICTLMSGLRLTMNNSWNIQPVDDGTGADRPSAQAAPDTNRIASAFHRIIGSRIVRTFRPTWRSQSWVRDDPSTSQPEIRQIGRAHA